MPDVAVEVTAADYFAGRDPVMEGVLAYGHSSGGIRADFQRPDEGAWPRVAYSRAKPSPTHP